MRPGSDRRQLCEDLIETLNKHQLEQLQREPTCQGTLLDLFCTNMPSLVATMDIVPGISGHDILVVDTVIKAKSTKKPKRLSRQYLV